jgi:hypothetical protein
MIANSFGAARNVTATATINPQMGRLIGFYVNSTTGGTLVLRDGGGSGTALSGTITPAIGWHAFPATYVTDLHATIANTLNVTFFVS